MRELAMRLADAECVLRNILTAAGFDHERPDALVFWVGFNMFLGQTDEFAAVGQAPSFLIEWGSIEPIAGGGIYLNFVRMFKIVSGGVYDSTFETRCDMNCDVGDEPLRIRGGMAPVGRKNLIADIFDVERNTDFRELIRYPRDWRHEIYSQQQ